MAVQQGWPINDRDQFSIDAALILSTFAHAAFGLDGVLFDIVCHLHVLRLFRGCAKLMYGVARRWTPKDIPGQSLLKVCPWVVQQALRALRCQFVDRPRCVCERLMSYFVFLDYRVGFADRDDVGGLVHRQCLEARGLGE